MKITKVVPSGYCKGVVNAIRLAKKTREDNPERNIYILGMLVHNEHVSQELSQMGIITLDDSLKSKEELVDDLSEGIVIFTAHGISEKIRQKVIDKGLDYVDASCVDVLKTQQIIKDKLDQGYDVLYFGKKKHPEAEAVLSISERIHLICDEKDLEAFNTDNDRLFLTNQTTMSYLELKDLIEAAKKRFPTLEIQKEICNATSARQEAVARLEDCDLLYVVGDKKSNNTSKLVDIGISRGIKKVLLIQTYLDINTDDLAGAKHICVTAGASTPPKLIEEVITFLRAETA